MDKKTETFVSPVAFQQVISRLVLGSVFFPKLETSLPMKEEPLLLTSFIPDNVWIE